MIESLKSSFENKQTSFTWRKQQHGPTNITAMNTLERYLSILLRKNLTLTTSCNLKQNKKFWILFSRTLSRIKLKHLLWKTPVVNLCSMKRKLINSPWCTKFSAESIQLLNLLLPKWMITLWKKEKRLSKTNNYFRTQSNSRNHYLSLKLKWIN